MDASLISAGVGALGSFIGIGTSNAVSSIKANSENAIRALNNQAAAVLTQRNAALTSLQRWAQGVRNDRVMEGLSANQAAMATNYNRARDARTRQNFSTNIQQAEAMGRTQAAAAASGVTGSVVDMINQASSMKIAMENTARLQAERQVSYDYRTAALQQTYAAIDQLDTGLIFDSPEMMDFRQSLSQSSNAGLAAGVTFLTQGGLNSFFNKPKASGSDTLDAFLALNDNFSGA